MYNEVHRLHASLLLPQLTSGECTVYDIGASTGRWFRVLRKILNVDNLNKVQGLHCYAFDNSFPMLEKLRSEFPEVNASWMDVAAPTAPHPNADIVTMFYVLQFIKPDYKIIALRWIYEHLNPGGTLVLGQKDCMADETDRLFQEEYIRFRLTNGYTQEEIDAKTAALKNAQWLLSPGQLAVMLFEIGFTHIYTTTRWLNFSTLVAQK
jgi:tRNA (cmo5U34)-methyltransferase